MKTNSYLTPNRYGESRQLALHLIYLVLWRLRAASGEARDTLDGGAAAETRPSDAGVASSTVASLIPTVWGPTPGSRPHCIESSGKTTERFLCNLLAVKIIQSITLLSTVLKIENAKYQNAPLFDGYSYYTVPRVKCVVKR